MLLENQVRKFSESIILNRGEPLEKFRSTLVNVFGPQGHFFKNFVSHVAERTPILEEGKVPEEIGWINQLFYQVSLENQTEKKQQTIEILDSSLTLLDNYGLTLLDRQEAITEENLDIAKDILKIFPGLFPLSTFRDLAYDKTGSHKSTQFKISRRKLLDLKETDKLKIHSPPIAGRMHHYSRDYYLQFVQSSLEVIQMPEIAALFAANFYDAMVFSGLEEFQITSETIIANQQTPLFKIIRDFLKRGIQNYKLVKMDGFQQSICSRNVTNVNLQGIGIAFYHLLREGKAALTKFPDWISGRDEVILTQLLEGNPVLEIRGEKVLYSLLETLYDIALELSDSRDLEFASRLLNGIPTVYGRYIFLDTINNTSQSDEEKINLQKRIITEGNPLRVKQEVENAVKNKLYKPKRFIPRYPEFITPYDINKHKRMLAGKIPLSEGVDPTPLFRTEELYSTASYQEYRGISFEEIRRDIVQQHALEHLLGTDSFRGLLKAISSSLTKNIGTADHNIKTGFWGSKYAPDEVAEIAGNLESHIIQDHAVAVHSTKPTFLVQAIQPRTDHSLTFFIKLFPEENSSAAVQEFLNSYGFTNLLRDPKGAQLPKPFSISDHGITARDGKEYLAVVWPAINGECAYRRLNGWLGEERKVWSQADKREYFMKAVDQLVRIHFQGLKKEGMENIAGNYFSKRVREICFGKFKGELLINIEEADQQAILDHYHRIEAVLNSLSITLGGYYKDASPRNDIITPKGVVPIDFEHKRIVFRSIDLVSMMETGWEFPEDEIVHSPEKDYLTPIEKANLIDRYVLLSARLNPQYHSPAGVMEAIKRRPVIDEILKQRDISRPEVYAGHPRFKELVDSNFHDQLIWGFFGVARLQRHLEYAGYAARDVKRAIDHRDERQMQVEIRRVAYHAQEAANAARFMAPQGFGKLAQLLESFVDKYCTLQALRTAVQTLL